MRIALLLATRRGQLVLQKLAQLRPEAELLVCSFREEPHEPPFLEAIRELTGSVGGRFVEARQVSDSLIGEVDLLLAVSWRYRIPPGVYRRARKGAYVFHDSLLPEYRGFAPTVWAIINGEDHTGVTLFRIAEEFDAGDIVDQERVPIGPANPIAVVMDRVTDRYLALLERNLEALLAGTVALRPQDHARASYACKRLPADNEIRWSDTTERIYNLVRAVSAPYPGAFTILAGRTLRVWSVKHVPAPRRWVGRVPGRVVEVGAAGPVVLTGDGALVLGDVQLDGQAATPASAVLTSVGQMLGREL